MADDIKKLMDETKSTLHTMQTRLEEVKKTGATSSEGLEELKGQFNSHVQNVEKLNNELKAEQKAREELELILAKQNEAGSGEVKSDEAYRKSFVSFLRKNRVDVNEDAIEKEFDNYVGEFCKSMDENEKALAKKALIVGSDPNGGYLVPLDTIRKISERVFESSPMRQESSVITTLNEAVPIILDDDEFGYQWVGELDTRTETGTAQIGEVIIPIHEVMAYPKASQKLLDDASVDMESWLTSKVTNRLSRAENEAFVKGDGSKKPTGLLHYDAWAAAGTYERGKLETAITDGVGVIAVGDLVKLQNSMFEAYQSGAIWGMTRDTFSDIVLLKDSHGRFQIDPQLLFNGAQLQLLGKTVRIFGDLESNAAGNTPVVYGNMMEGYTIADRIGLRVVRDNITQPGFVKWNVSKRVGGAVTNFQAIKRLQVKS